MTENYANSYERKSPMGSTRVKQVFAGSASCVLFTSTEEQDDIIHVGDKTARHGVTIRSVS